MSIVDEVFEAVDNTKQNLTNACELFDSYLNAIFMQKGERWKEKKFSDIAILSRGQNPPKSKFINNPKEGYVTHIPHFNFYDMYWSRRLDSLAILPIETR